jgi:Rrf2 family nitric oxide-sensitive transcriptional repressor
MRLSTFTDYSVRVLVHLAARPGQRATIGEIASAFGISEHHLVKVVHFLGRKGWLKNIRGKGGGLELGRLPELIVLGQVVRDTEGEAVVAECFDERRSGCAIGRCCLVRGVLADAVAAFYSVLDRYTLADVTRNRDDLVRILMPVRPRAGMEQVSSAC